MACCAPEFVVVRPGPAGAPGKRKINVDLEPIYQISNFANNLPSLAGDDNQDMGQIQLQVCKKLCSITT